MLKRVWYEIVRFLRIKPRIPKEKQLEDEFKKKLEELRVILYGVDELLKKQGFNRNQRRQFWRDFFKYGEFRNDIFDELVKTGTLEGKKNAS